MAADEAGDATFSTGERCCCGGRVADVDDEVVGGRGRSGEGRGEAWETC